MIDQARLQFGSPTAPNFLEFAASEPTKHTTSTRSEGEAIPRAFETPTSAPRSDEEVERAAVATVCEYARRKLGVTKIVDRQADRIGWDLEFVYADGRQERVEVKGSGGKGPFGLTANELQAANSHDNYVLFYATNLRTDRPTLYRFDALGSKIDENHHLRASAYWVTGWRELEPVMIAISTEV